MDYITTTNLRTKSSKLVEALKKGKSVKLIHRSQVVGEIKPKIEEKAFDAQVFRRTLEKIKPSKVLPRSEREKVYRKHLEEKYGKDIS